MTSVLSTVAPRAAPLAVSNITKGDTSDLTINPKREGRLDMPKLDWSYHRRG
jgi:hypothetical protein